MAWFSFKPGSGSRIKRPAVIGLIAVLLAGISAYSAYAVVSSTVFSACLNDRGALYNVTTGAAKPCKSGDTAVTWNQAGPKGDQGLAGPQGPAGPSGVLTVAPFAGLIGAVPSDAKWHYIGHSAAVNTDGSQRITVTAAATLGTTGAPFSFQYDVCYAQLFGAPILMNDPDNRPVGHAQSHSQVFTVTASVVPPAGGWFVGMCVYSDNPMWSLDNNETMNGYVMVTQEP